MQILPTNSIASASENFGDFQVADDYVLHIYDTQTNTNKCYSYSGEPQLRLLDKASLTSPALADDRFCKDN